MNVPSKLLFILASVLLLRTTDARCEQAKIRIGVIAPLSGQMATLGTALKNGIELARHDRPEIFQNTEWFFEDDRFDGKVSLTAYFKLKNVNHASLIFGFGDTLGHVLGPLSERDKLPLLNFNFEASSAVGRNWFVRSMNPTEHYMRALGEYLVRKGSSTFLIVRSESPFFNAMTTSLQRAVEGRAKLQEIAVVNPSETDFRTIITKLKTSGSKPVGLFLSPNQLISFMTQAKTLGFAHQYFGTDLFETAAGMADQKDLFVDCLYPDNDASQEFRSRYRSQYGNESQLTFAASAYDLTILLGETLAKERSVTAVQLMDSFRAVSNRTGVLGQFSFQSEPTLGMFFGFPVHVKKISATIGVPTN